MQSVKGNSGKGPSPGIPRPPLGCRPPSGQRAFEAVYAPWTKPALLGCESTSSCSGPNHSPAPTPARSLVIPSACCLHALRSFPSCLCAFACVPFLLPGRPAPLPAGPSKPCSSLCPVQMPPPPGSLPSLGPNDALPAPRAPGPCGVLGLRCGLNYHIFVLPPAPRPSPPASRL